jgi:hypothetical protein
VGGTGGMSPRRARTEPSRISKVPEKKPPGRKKKAQGRRALGLPLRVPRLRRANLTHEKNGEAWQDHGDKMALASKSLVLLGGHSRFRKILVMGFPPHHRFPL